MPITSINPFKGRHFPGEVILVCVRRYLRYPLAYEHVAELLAERGVEVDPSCIWCWVQAYAPELNKRCRPHLKPTNKSYRTDETYIKVKGEDKYLYRAVDSTGQTIEFPAHSQTRRDRIPENDIQVLPVPLGGYTSHRPPGGIGGFQFSSASLIQFWCVALYPASNGFWPMEWIELRQDSPSGTALLKALRDSGPFDFTMKKYRAFEVVCARKRSQMRKFPSSDKTRRTGRDEKKRRAQIRA